MRKIYKIAQYNRNHIQVGDGMMARTGGLQQGRNQQVRTCNETSEVDLILNKEFDTEENALAALAYCNFTDEQLQSFEIVVQLRADVPVTPKSELEAIKEIMPEDSPEWAKRLVALLEKQTNAKDSL